MSSTHDDPEARYAEILRRIEGKRAAPHTSQHGSLAAVLDGLNAMGVLESMRKKRLSSISLYGPKALRGLLDADADTHRRSWSGAVAWYKPRGYHHFRELTLLGIWALEGESAPQIMIATKTLEFDAPVFNPESYYREIKRRFDLYYRGDGSPTGLTPILSTDYDPGQRLALRQAVEKSLTAWAKTLPPSADQV